MRSAALVHREGSIDWMCLPRFDSPWLFGRLVDWQRGGYLRVAPEQSCTPSREYRTDSNVLETTWVRGREQAQVIDFMPVAGGRHRAPAAALRLLRMIQPIRGELQWRVDFWPVFSYGRRRTRYTTPEPGWLTARSGSAAVALEFPPHFETQQANGRITLTGSLPVGETAVIALHDACPARADRTGWARATQLLEATDQFWRAWLRQCSYRGSYAPLVRRSVLLLKLLQYQATGAFVAAPTSSLPEADGGPLNWDYRFTWLRDMSVLVDTLAQLGFVAEVDQFMEWLDHTCECAPADFQMLYRVDGDRDVAEHELTGLDGYRGSRPVRIGNAAADQKQLDVYGEVMEAAHAAWKRTRRMPRARRALLVQVVDYVLQHWEESDSGIWESRSRPKRYLYSQAMCWLALDRALRMEAALRLGRQRAAEVRRIRTRVRREVLSRGYNPKMGAFTQALDDDTLDASALTVPLTGMLPASDWRVVATVDAVLGHLTKNGLVYRHIGAESEFGHDEGAFLVCSFWLVDVLAQMGRVSEAKAMLARVSRAGNDLGLLAEEFDPERGHVTGNFPLALSHLSLLGAVLNVERAVRARGRSARPATPSRAGWRPARVH